MLLFVDLAPCSLLMHVPGTVFGSWADANDGRYTRRSEHYTPSRRSETLNILLVTPQVPASAAFISASPTTVVAISAATSI